MSGGDGRDRDTLGGLTAFGHAVVVMVVAATIGLVWTSVDAVRTKREIAYQQAQERCQGTSNTDCQELAAADRSADADERAADVAAQQLWLNIIGIVGLGATVWFAGRAWWEARRSADIADAALKRSDRPYVLPAHVEITGLRNATDEKPAAFSFKMTNFGTGPAFTRKYYVGLEVYPDIPPAPTYPYDWDTSIVVPPNGHFGSQGKTTITISDADRDAIIAGTKKLIIIGRLAYTDVGRDAHLTRFAYVYRPYSSDETDTMVAIDSAAYWEYN